jgi:hypothetical protein
MRLLIASAAFLLTTTAAAQSRWTLSTGPEWSRGIPALRTWGARFRVEYDITRPSSVFGLRLESGARWSPTQSYFYSDGIVTVSGTGQTFDLLLGFNASLSPIPNAPVSPYIGMGIFGRQEWTHGWSSAGFGPLPEPSPAHTSTHGDIIGSLGLGLRARLASHQFQLEYRRIYDHSGLTFGTRLPF